MLLLDHLVEKKEHFSKNEIKEAIGKGLVVAAAIFTALTIISSLHK